MQWAWLQTFLRVASLGSLSAAARDLAISQPTASRHIQALEAELQRPLFVRHARGIHLTPAGQALLDEAQGIDTKVEAILRRRGGSEQEPSGSVRVSVNEPIGLHVLVDWLRAMRERFPDIALEMVVDNRASDLTRREADVAVRMFRPRQARLVASRVGEVNLALYAHERYLQRWGVPESRRDLRGHTLIGLDQDPSWAPTLRALGMRAEDFAIRTDSLALHVEAIRAGAAIGGLHRAFARRHPDLREVLTQVPLPPLEMWVATHEDLKPEPAVRAVYASLVDHLRAYVA